MSWRPPRLPYLGLRTRIAMVVILITTMATTGMALGAYQLQANTTKDRFDNAANAGFSSDIAQARARVDAVAGQPHNRVERVVDYMRGRQGVDWGVFAYHGSPRPAEGHGPPATMVASSTWLRPSAIGAIPHPPSWMLDEAYLGTQPQPSTTMETDGGVPVQVIAGWLAPRLALVEYYNLGPMRAELDRLQDILTMIALVVAALGVVAAVIAAARIQRPVRRVAAAARELGDGDLDIRLPVRGRDELADLTSSFNTMARRLSESIEELKAKDNQQRRFVADVAHDLRTPVASVVAAADSLEHADPQSRARSAHLLGTQARRLAKLVEDLLEISRFDAGAAELRPERVDLAALVREAIEVSTGEAEVRLAAEGDVTVTADPRRLHTIACNLLANSVRHGAAPITVTIDGTRFDLVTVRVADSGPGIPEELMPILFDRFVRGDRSRRATEGSGLGLAIVKENVAAHGGRIEVTNMDGAVFTLALPRHAQDRPAEDAG
ncbi:sensor histidine kinase [Amycolatopsis cihanbeyliensis]|uniref:Signal transduction histidine-protein kinase/phosphatase MprB n=1 Tax=Amycolatopsis cihanbeyliensis TaxID=1128664 RepID=A0A542DQW4_AMYCI|nr:HAMP domain-containing sensor histidine kinase [Amycolatopsis cihanbeyliensis]TQJ05345.1 two-component system sensor histidine kinase MtrB [Amycolatopsis cihanbeyliensis]